MYYFLSQMEPLSAEMSHLVKGEDYERNEAEDYAVGSSEGGEVLGLPHVRIRCYTTLLLLSLSFLIYFPYDYLTLRSFSDKVLRKFGFSQYHLLGTV